MDEVEDHVWGRVQAESTDRPFAEHDATSSDLAHRPIQRRESETMDTSGQGLPEGLWNAPVV